MPRLSQALLTVVLLSSALVAAAPAVEKSVSRKTTSLSQQGSLRFSPYSFMPSISNSVLTFLVMCSLPAKSSSLDTKKKLRRGKRHVIIQEVPEDNDEDVIRDQLQQLSDDQLAVLAEIVQNEINKYSPEIARGPQYEVVEIPDELLEAAELFPRDRRVPIVDLDDLEDDTEEATPELVVVPEEVVEDALHEQQDDMELRMRIAEIAQILNERASRRIQLI
uniref:DUF1716 domain-containing protein n=1 Tax=Heterorhabditis bacteriophora TaxID=37862 RepID=A0A1I7XMS2_HETBA